MKLDKLFTKSNFYHITLTIHINQLCFIKFIRIILIFYVYSIQSKYLRTKNGLSEKGEFFKN